LITSNLGVVADKGVLNASLGDQTVAVLQGDVVTLVVQAVQTTEAFVLFAKEGSEAPLLGDDDVLATGELVRGTTESLDQVTPVRVLGAARVDDLADVDAGADTEGFTEGVTHTTGQPIGTSATKHFVLTENVVGVETNAHVESVFADMLEHVLVHNNTSGFHTFGTQLLLLTAHQVDAQREIVGGGAAFTDIKDGDLGIGNTTQVTRLDVRLVLAVTVTTSGTTTHFALNKLGLSQKMSERHAGHTLGGKAYCGMRTTASKIIQRLGSSPLDSSMKARLAIVGTEAAPSIHGSTVSE